MYIDCCLLLSHTVVLAGTSFYDNELQWHHNMVPYSIVFFLTPTLSIPMASLHMYAPTITTDSGLPSMGDNHVSGLAAWDVWQVAELHHGLWLFSLLKMGVLQTECVKGIV